MLKYLLFIAILFLSSIINAQEWTEPINISNIDGFDRDPDIAIGPDGTLHCVWEHSYSNYFRKIFYSFSTDEGYKWSTPQDVSKNDTLWLNDPHIACDSQNNIYITYEYNAYSSSIVVIQKYNGESWSKIDSVAEGYSYNNRIYIDNEDRIYVFWYKGNDKIYYRYFENDSWSDIIIPYNTDDFNILHEAIIDENNNIHVIGNYNGYISYFEYNASTDHWYTPIKLSNNLHLYEGSDITVNYNNPHLVWHENYSDNYSFNHATFYRKYNGIQWSSPIILSENAFQQKITYTNNTPYIMDVISISDDSTNVTLYQKDQHGNWFGTKTLKTTNWIGFMDFGVINNKLYNLFYWRYDDEQFDIYFRKTQYGVGVNEIENINSLFSLYQNFPNPFSNSTNIQYAIKNKGFCSLKIYNIEGKLVKILVNKKQEPGNYNVKWNGRNSDGNKLTNGIYLYQLNLDNYQITKSLIIN